MENLQKAIEFNPRYRKDAKTDPNFQPFAQDDWFNDLTGAN